MSLDLIIEEEVKQYRKETAHERMNHDSSSSSEESSSLSSEYSDENELCDEQKR